MDLPSHRPSKGRIAARFGRAAEAYESGAVVQAEIVERVASAMRGSIGVGGLWCDFGSGGGLLAERVGAGGGVRFICLDLAFAPLSRALRLGRPGMAVCGDIDFPPVRPASLDGASVVSALQWAERPQEALRGMARALKPGASLYFSAFVEGSFAELIEARSRMGLPGLPSEVWLPPADEFTAALDGAGFDVPADGVESFERVQMFPDARSVLVSMSGTGVTAAGGRLLGRAEIEELCERYTLLFSKDGTVPLTYRAVIGKAGVRAE
ncbi:MAG: methyltransferase domain-containing protein [Chitinispirillia bacterium]|nr:methyltransferase domain-containing protein [Chitinispirillia bacterium]